MRLIDADALLDKQECIYMKGHVLFHGVTAFSIENAPTIDPETLPIVRQLREELARVTAERDAAVKDLEAAMGIDVNDDCALITFLCSVCAKENNCNEERCHPKWRGPRKEENQ